MAEGDTIPGRDSLSIRHPGPLHQVLINEYLTLAQAAGTRETKSGLVANGRDCCPHPVNSADSKAEAASMKEEKKNKGLALPQIPPGLIETIAGSGGEPGKLVVSKESRQRQLLLPDGWSEKEKRAQPGFLYCRYQAADSPFAQLVYWNRGYGGVKLAADVACNFKELLKKPPHELSPAESRAMQSVLSNGVYDNDGCFEIAPGGLRTIELKDGSRVLLLEANWKDSNKKSYGIFADFDGSGQYVEQVYMIAPGKDYALRLDQVRDSIHSLKWK